MRTIHCVLIALSLLTAAPVALAEPAQDDGDDAKPTCVEVNIFSFPPVYTYECEAWPPAP